MQQIEITKKLRGLWCFYLWMGHAWIPSPFCIKCIQMLFGGVTKINQNQPSDFHGALWESPAQISGWMSNPKWVCCFGVFLFRLPALKSTVRTCQEAFRKGYYIFQPPVIQVLVSWSVINWLLCFEAFIPFKNTGEEQLCSSNVSV